MATAGVPLWSTTAASNASADPAVNWAEGQSPSSVNDSARGMMASIAKWRNDLYGLTTSGSSTAFTVTTNATYASASDMSGAIFTVIPHTTSGTTPTLAVDGLTARNINISTGVSVPDGALVEDTPYLVKYVHATTEFIVLGAVGKDQLETLDIINGTQSTTIATGDTLPIYDLSETANRRMLVSDFLKVINALSADSSPDREADYIMTYDASASAAKKVLLTDIPVVQPIVGGHKGLIVKNNASTPDSQVDIDADALIVETTGGVTYRLTGINLTINAATTGANALDTGSLQASTWYAVFVIYDPVNATTAGLLSASASSPTMPDGYTAKARVGWMRTDASVDFVRVLQKGKRAQYVAASGSPTPNAPIAASGAAGDTTAPTWSEVSLTNYVPSTAVSVQGFIVRSGTNAVMAAPNNSYGARGSTTNPPPVVSFQSEGVGNIPFSFVLESTSIYWASSQSGSAVGVLGWEDDI